MCEWCDRLILRNYKWDRHAFSWADAFIFKYTMKSQWHKDWYKRKDYLRGEDWLFKHSDWGYIGERKWNRAAGVGSRYYWRD